MYNINMNTKDIKLKYIIKYIISIILIFIILFLITSIKFKENNNKIHNIEKREILKENKDYKVIVYYPYFKNKNINDKITEYIYNYTNNFIKNEKGKRNLKINYEINYKNNLINIFFIINNSLYKNKIYKSFNFNISSYIKTSVSQNNDILNNYIKQKYSTEIYNVIKDLDESDINYKVTENYIHYYFNNNLFKDINYIPNICIDYNGKIVHEKEKYDKVIAFTFDDGPSKYTVDFKNTLILNNSKATFFMLGNRMKYNQDIISNIKENNMEIGSHTYSHKNLNHLNEKEVISEINSVTILYHEITDEDIKLFRPPYGNINQSVKKIVPFPIILWNIDTLDWLHRDKLKTYNSIIKNIKDGSIVLMHEHPETLEALKMILPTLKEMGYKITTVSELAKEKNTTLIPGNIYKSFNNYNLPF